MFRREIYRAMQPVLDAMVPEALEARGFALGGATRIALTFGEVRESGDLDFVGSDPRGYAELRAAVREHGYGALFRDPSALDLPREPTSDQYGIRFPVRVGARTIKVEIIHEGRVVLGPPVREPFSRLPCLSLRDCFVEKLLANSDRGADPAQLERDLIDLAVLRSAVGPIPEEAWLLASGAYGASVRTDLEKSIQRLRGDVKRRDRVLAGLRVDDVDRVLAGVEELAADLGLPPPPAEDDADG